MRIDKAILEKRKYLIHHSWYKVTIFTLSLLMLIFIILFSVYEYNSISKEFLDNNNPHIIEIMYNNNNDDGILLPKDRSNIIKLLGRKYSNKEYKIGVEKQIHLSFVDANENTYFIYSLDNMYQELLGLKKMETEVFYNPFDKEENNVSIKIPVVDVKTDGFNSSKFYPMNITVKGIRDCNKHFISSDNSLTKHYVSSDTYNNIVGVIYNKNKQNYTDGIQSVSKIYIYVKNLKQINKIANTLVTNSYGLNYIMDAFGDLDASIYNILVLLIFICLLMVVLSIASIVLEVKNDLNMQKKDIAIFKHYGYSSKVIFRLYSKELTKIFQILSILILIIQWLLSIFIFKDITLLQSILISIIVIGINFVVYFISSIIIKNLVNQSVLELLKDRIYE